MTKTEYLAELEKYLKKLPRKDYEETIEHFTEYFDEVGPEGEVAAIADLGNPKEAAHEIMIHLLDKKIIKRIIQQIVQRISFKFLFCQFWQLP